jgi:hypothetical protein
MYARSLQHTETKYYRKLFSLITNEQQVPMLPHTKTTIYTMLFSLISNGHQVPMLPHTKTTNYRKLFSLILNGEQAIRVLWLTVWLKRSQMYLRSRFEAGGEHCVAMVTRAVTSDSGKGVITCNITDLGPRMFHS